MDDHIQLKQLIDWSVPTLFVAVSIFTIGASPLPSRLLEERTTAGQYVIFSAIYTAIIEQDQG